jgi:hypothetical protein
MDFMTKPIKRLTGGGDICIIPGSFHASSRPTPGFATASRQRATALVDRGLAAPTRTDTTPAVPSTRPVAASYGIFKVTPAQPDDERVLPDADQHIAVEEEADAAEHLLLLDTFLPG